MREKYIEKAKAIRRDCKETMATFDNPMYDSTYAAQQKKEAKYQASQKMAQLRRDYQAECDEIMEERKKNAFVCYDMSNGEFLQIVEQCDKGNRFKMANTAVLMGASNDTLRAIALSAHNGNDSRTIDFIIDNAAAEVSDPLNDLRVIKTDDRYFMMFGLSMAVMDGE
jgi:spore coat polysaccharide biosynthesis predicted glycosyltransferase SpsG